MEFANLPQRYMKIFFNLFGLDWTILLKLKVKVKVNFTLEEARKAQGGSKGIALLFL
jgi:hypothetical protein